MNTIIDTLFERIRAKEEKVRYDAALDLSCILEMHNFNFSKNSKINRYESLVSKEIIKLKLDDKELKRIVEFFENEINNGNRLSSNIGLKPLLSAIDNNWQDFDENEFYQALISLERMLFWSEGLSLEEEKEIMSGTGLLTKISEKILSLQPISHVDLESTASRFLARLILLLEID